MHGDTIGEPGYGSNPLDMMIYTDPFDHKDYLLVTIDVRSASRIEAAELASAQPEPTGGSIDFGPGGLGRTQRDLPIRAEHFAILGFAMGGRHLAAPENIVSPQHRDADGAVLLRPPVGHGGNELARWSGPVPLPGSSQRGRSCIAGLPGRDGHDQVSMGEDSGEAPTDIAGRSRRVPRRSSLHRRTQSRS